MPSGDPELAPPMRSMSAAVQLLAVVLALLAAPWALAQTEWKSLPPIPDESGFAGAFVGVSGDALLFAGGANFPKPEWQNDKAWHGDIYVLPSPDAAWIKAGRLPRAMGYGMSVTWQGELICIGGRDAESVYADVFALAWDGQAIATRKLPALPQPTVHAGAALIGSVLYVIAGQNQSSIQSATARGFRMDLSSDKPKWRSIPDLPGGARAHPLVTVQHNGRGERLYLIGGRREDSAGPFGLEFLSEVWEFDPGAASWRQRRDSPRPMTAGTVVPTGQSNLLVLSYADGSILREVEASGLLMRAFDHPGFPRELYTYHTITDAWASAGSIPEGTDSQVTTTAVTWRGSLVMPSGEVRPRVRTPEVWAVSLTPRSRAFGGINMGVLILYLLGMVGVGVYFASRNKNTDDYFRGGQSIPWWAAACSIYATMLSSLTYVALPALVFATDWLLYPGMFMILATAPVAIRIAMPFFRRIDATSAYEFFGKRFGLSLRLISSGLFTLFHISRMGIVMALTALALAAVTGFSPAACVLIMGGLCLVYCTLGGIEAVIWTDTIQTFVLFGGAIFCLIFMLAGIDGGLGEMIDVGQAENKFRLFDFDFGTDSASGLAIWVIVLGGLGQNLSSYTADQAVVQRYVSTSSPESAARAIWMNGIMAIPGSLLFFLLGTALYTFYRANPEKLDPTIQNDQLFPLFISAELPVGFAGLIVAGIFAAAQSTVSTSMNSTATTVVTDFLRPFRICKSEKSYLNAARLLTLIMGTLGTGAGLLFISPEIRSLMSEYFKVIGMFMGALGGLFLLGVTSRRANGTGALIGLLTGVIVMVIVWQCTTINGYLYATLGIVTCWSVGYLASLLLPSNTRSLEGLTIHTLPAELTPSSSSAPLSDS